jgi:hypothetical protein
VDGLDLKVDKLCQLASTLLERSIRQQPSPPVPTPTSIAPIVINRIRIGNRFHVYRRRQRTHPSIPMATLATQPPPAVLTPSTRSSSRTNLTQPSVPPTSPARDHSRESLVSLYWLFQDNINSTRTPVV